MKKAFLALLFLLLMSAPVCAQSTAQDINYLAVYRHYNTITGDHLLLLTNLRAKF